MAIVMVLQIFMASVQPSIRYREPVHNHATVLRLMNETHSAASNLTHVKYVETIPLSIAVLILWLIFTSIRAQFMSDKFQKVKEITFLPEPPPPRYKFIV